MYKYTIDIVGIYISLSFYIIGYLLFGTSALAGIFVFQVAVVPLVFKYCKTFRRILIFANFVQWPLHVDFEEPSRCGINGGRNLNLEFQSKVDQSHVKLGVWHILPKSSYERLKGHFDGNTDKEEINRLLDHELANSNLPILVYFHGNSNSRATAHRILLYKVFQKMDFHTISFDYRGYGDSTYIPPTEAGVVEDSLIVYEWLLRTTAYKNHSPPIFLWGHSLGTGISACLLGNIEELSAKVLERPPLPLPNALILEAPFNNLAEEVAHYPLTVLVTWLPYFEKAFVDPFRTNPEQTFRSDVYLARLKDLPVLILHAKDDLVIPYKVGLMLYRSIKNSRLDGGADCKFHSFEKKENLGHKYICMAEDLPEVLGPFVSTYS